ncbi:MAG: hypothetical protein ACFFDH_00640 [Promethearchaeota archaeon]
MAEKKKLNTNIFKVCCVRDGKEVIIKKHQTCCYLCQADKIKKREAERRQMKERNKIIKDSGGIFSNEDFKR